MPFSGPIGASKVGYINGEYVLNPSTTQLEESKLNLVVAGTDKAVLMVESEADLLSEEVMLGAVTFGHDALKAVVTAINELVAEANVTKWEWEAEVEDTDLKAKVEAAAKEGLMAAYSIADKMDRQAAVGEVKKSVIESLCDEEDENAPSAGAVAGAFGKLEKFLVRDHILSGNPRIDGRDVTTVRPITVKTGILPRTHGSALFTRGETQAIATVTLGTTRDAQLIDQNRLSHLVSRWRFQSGSRHRYSSRRWSQGRHLCACRSYQMRADSGLPVSQRPQDQGFACRRAN